MENLLTILSFQTYRKRLRPELTVANLGKSTHWYYIEETKYPKKIAKLGQWPHKFTELLPKAILHFSQSSSLNFN